MSFRALFFALSLAFLPASIPSFSQVAPPQRAEMVAVGGQWGDMKPLKTETRAGEVGGSSNPLFLQQKRMFDQIGVSRLLERRGGAILRTPGATVFFVGTGVDATHPDLVGRVDCAQSQTFIEGGGNPCTDDLRHDTGVATIGFANSEDGVGMRGIAGGTPIISLKVMTVKTNQFGQPVKEASPDAIIEAFRYINERADAEPEQMIIVVAAFVYDGVDPVLLGILKDIEKKGNVYIVASSDNIRFLNSVAQPALPCSASTLSNIDCVASLNFDGGLALWSSFGGAITQTGYCDNIVAGYPGGRYGNFVGNSGCVPQVAALASLVWGYAKERGRNLTAAELKMLMQRGASFAPGLVSAIIQYEVATPHTLDAEKLFRVVDAYLAGELEPLTERTLKVSSVKSSDFGVITDLKVKERYAIAGQGFSPDYALLLNGMPIPFTYSGDLAEFELPEAASFFAIRGGDNVLYFARVGKGGEVDPFSINKVHSGFSIR